MDGFAEIKRISRRDDGRVLIRLTVGNGSGSEDVEFLILDELFDSISSEVESGALSMDTIVLLDEYASVTAAFSSACSSLGFAQCSVRALFKKLLSKGFSKDVCEAAIDFVILRGYIDENSTAVRRAEIMLSKLWGRSRIFAKLREEGFSDCALEEVAVFLEEVDFVDGCVRVIERKYAPIPTERREREKTYAALLRLGYSSSEIKAAIKRIESDE
jgi:SOS response regulatory protein OraA/RecX